MHAENIASRAMRYISRLTHEEKIVVQITKDFKNINVSIVGDARIREVNKQFLNCNYPTDCLSFDLSDDDTDAPKSLELIVNAEAAVREANLRGHSTEAELALYITHGLLHNLGFDDSTRDQARKTHDTEDEILQQFGYGLVYNKSARAQERNGTRDL